MKCYYVYMMSNVSRMIYTGMTNNLSKRIKDHKHKRNNGFTQQYNIHRLVYYEEFQEVRTAIGREKEIKGWRREKKVALIEQINPTWKDLSKS